MAEDTAEVSKYSCVRGYHVYKDAWRVAIGEELVRQREQGAYTIFTRGLALHLLACWLQ